VFRLFVVIKSDNVKIVLSRVPLVDPDPYMMRMRARVVYEAVSVADRIRPGSGWNAVEL